MELVQEPTYTLETKAGDCDDHAVLIASLLGSIGYKGALAITSDHGFALVCNLDAEEVRQSSPPNNPVKYWKIDDQLCFPLEPSVENTYIGYCPVESGTSIYVVDPIEKRLEIVRS
jgi:hypothetical protein